MAQLPIKFNSEGNKDGLADFSALPAGEYIMAITKSEYKATKANNGHYLQLVFKVLTGPQKGKWYFENLNLDNPNPIAVEIANKALNSICQACDKEAVEDSEELHEIPMVVTLKVVPATATRPASNGTVAYKPCDAVDLEMADTGGPGAGPEPTLAPTKKVKKLPWEK